MKFAFHIWGSRVGEFADYVSVPKTLLYRPGDAIPVSPKGDICISLGDEREAPQEANGVQYRNNYDRPHGARYVVFYGDVRNIRRDRRIPVACDIMDENFWYYWEALQQFGLFTFSVNSTLCDILIYEKTVENLRSTAKPVKYGALA